MILHATANKMTFPSLLRRGVAVLSFRLRALREDGRNLPSPFEGEGRG